ncbi:basic proline-rich protein-like [Atheta coriaria]|uniref:basic proline-rich protein-like n=1 Tax=Dalotia coriaria TaxID=877792 RepID=UPI0031F47116
MRSSRRGPSLGGGPTPANRAVWAVQCPSVGDQRRVLKPRTQSCPTTRGLWGPVAVVVPLTPVPQKSLDPPPVGPPSGMGPPPSRGPKAAGAPFPKENARGPDATTSTPKPVSAPLAPAREMMEKPPLSMRFPRHPYEGPLATLASSGSRGAPGHSPSSRSIDGPWPLPSSRSIGGPRAPLASSRSGGPGHSPSSGPPTDPWPYKTPRRRAPHPRWAHHIRPSRVPPVAPGPSGTPSQMPKPTAPGHRGPPKKVPVSTPQRAPRPRWHAD